VEDREEPVMESMELRTLQAPPTISGAFNSNNNNNNNNNYTNNNTINYSNNNTINYSNNRSTTYDNISRIQSQVDSVKEIAIENIDAILQRGERIEIMESRGMLLSDTSFQFKSQAIRLKRRLWWRTWRNICLVCCFLFFFFVLI
jgi:Synaptobrevin